MNRKTFFRTLAAQCLRMANPAASLWEMLADPRAETDPPCAVDTLYREAMRLGIDPASMDRIHLREMVAAQREETFRQKKIRQGKEGSSSETTV